MNLKILCRFIYFCIYCDLLSCRRKLGYICCLVHILLFNLCNQNIYNNYRPFEHPHPKVNNKNRWIYSFPDFKRCFYAIKYSASILLVCLSITTFSHSVKKKIDLKNKMFIIVQFVSKCQLNIRTCPKIYLI